MVVVLFMNICLYIIFFCDEGDYMKFVDRFFSMDFLHKLFLWFMISYPVFDLFFFYNSFTTLGRILFLFALLGMLLLLSSEARRKFYYLILYGVLVLIYFLVHHFHALNFHSLVPGDFDYSIVREFLYVLKMSMPVVVIFLLVFLRVTKEQYFKVVKWWVFLISGSIIVTNLFQISLGSYSGAVIQGNIFSWFSIPENGLSYYEVASKGFFMYANQISTICVMLLIMCSYFVFQYQSILGVGLIGGLALSMVMLGTRTASVGGLLVLIGLLFSFLFFQFIRREKIPWRICGAVFGIVLLWGGLLPFSPCMNRGDVMNSIYEEEEVPVAIAFDGEITSFDKTTYIEQNYEKKRIAKQFIYDYYPYQYDPEFWYDIMQLPVESRVNYRFLEMKMVERVVEINHNPYDRWFGISNTRVQNIFNIERDFVLQYYAFGIVGCVLFLGVYFGLFGIFMVHFVKYFRWWSILRVFMMGCVLLCSYVSGNNLNHLSVMVPALFLCIGMRRLDGDSETGF